MPGRRVAGLLLVIVLLAGCKSFAETSARLDREREAKAAAEARRRELDIDADYATRVCRVQALPGTVSGVTASLEARRTALDSARTRLTAEQYRKAVQTLSEYSADWEILNQSLGVACQVYMTCTARNSETSACSQQRAQYDTTVSRSQEFLYRLRALKLQPADTTTF